MRGLQGTLLLVEGSLPVPELTWCTLGASQRLCACSSSHTFLHTASCPGTLVRRARLYVGTHTRGSVLAFIWRLHGFMHTSLLPGWLCSLHWKRSNHISLLVFFVFLFAHFSLLCSFRHQVTSITIFHAKLPCYFHILNEQFTVSITIISPVLLI